MEASSSAKRTSTFREPGRTFSVMPRPEEPAQAAHLSAIRLWHWAAHTWMLSHLCRANSTAAHSTKHLPRGLPAQVKHSGMYMKGQGLVRYVHVPGGHRTDVSQPGDENSLKLMWPMALQRTSVIFYGTVQLFPAPLRGVTMSTMSSNTWQVSMLVSVLHTPRSRASEYEQHTKAI